MKKEVWQKEISVATFDFNGVDRHIHENELVNAEYQHLILLPALKGRPVVMMAAELQ